MENRFYAFCEVHKTVGPRRATKGEAIQDASAHAFSNPGHSGQVFVKESFARVSRNGKSYRDYRIHKL